jgi:hypothetical protein
MCFSAHSRSAHIAIKEKWRQTRISDTVAWQAHEGVACHTAAYRVHKSLGRASYRTSGSCGPDHCKKYADYITEQWGYNINFPGNSAAFWTGVGLPSRYFYFFEGAWLRVPKNVKMNS